MSARRRLLRHRDYLVHMLEATIHARKYVEGLSKDQFLLDAKTQDAVILKLLVIGEAATQCAAEAPEFIGAHPEIPWKDMPVSDEG